MAESTAEVLVGAVVVAAAIGFVAYTGQATGFVGGTRDAYTLSASFRSVEGVSVGTDVRLGGVKVGTVTDLDLNPETFRADATFSVRDGLTLPEDTAIIVASEGLLGGNFLELVPGGSPFSIEPGGEIVDTQSSVSLLNLLLRYIGGDGSSK